MPDLKKFRLRHFVEKLIDLGEVEVVEEPVDLVDVSRIVEASDKAVLFRKAGPEGTELVANVAGSRKRLAAAFGVPENQVVQEYRRRLANPRPVVNVAPEDAPVREVVFEGDEVDLTHLPFHPQHALDGSTYLSSAIDFSIDPETGTTNVGCRRLSLRNRTECGTNVTAPSDLQRIYCASIARGEKLPVSFAVGSHPLDFMAATMRIPADETALVGTLRGEPVPLVKSLTNDIRVPADAEVILEGYLCAEGYVEPEGPFGEYMGYYGPMHLNPVFHVTAITMRKDALHQSVLHGAGDVLGRVESANFVAIHLEARAFDILEKLGIDIRDARVTTSSGEGQHLRIAICQTAPGQARQAIEALFAELRIVKHIFVVDDDVDIWSESAMEWAMGTRFQAHKDLVVLTGMLGHPMDPSLGEDETGAKAGFDMTVPFGFGEKLLEKVTDPPVFEGAGRFRDVARALEGGPMYFTEIMQAVGSRDGREITLRLDELRNEGRLIRNEDGQYYLGAGQKGKTHLDHEPHKEKWSAK